MKKILLVSIILSLMVISTIQPRPIVAMPGDTTIITDKEVYKQFEYVTLTLRANKNLNTNLSISHFRVWASWYTPGGPVYALQETIVPASLENESTYYAVLTDAFQMTRANAYCFIEAYAYDEEGNAGYESVSVIYSTQKLPSEDNTSMQQNDYFFFFIIASLFLVILMLLILLLRIVRKKNK